MGEIPNYSQASPSLELHTEAFNPTMFYYGFLVVAMAIIILSVYHCLLVKCCSVRPPWAWSSGPNTGPGLRPEAPKDRVELGSVATFKYNSKGGRGGDECVVCLSMFEEGEELRELPRCKHSFHAPCIDRWLYSHFACPLCRAPVTNNQGDHVSIIIPGPIP